MTDDNFDYSRSRCAPNAAARTEFWLPFKPKEYLYAPASPNAPNKCEKSVNFIIEDTQAKRSVEQEDFNGTYSCFITTIDDAIDALGTITNPINYGKLLQATVQEKLRQVSQAVQAVLPVTAPCDNINDNDVTHSDPVTSLLDAGPNEETTPQKFEVSPIPQEIFEQQLVQSAPNVWASCDRFQPQTLIKDLQCQKSPDIDPHDIHHVDPHVCSWFEYMLPAPKFRCKFCHKLLSQGLMPESKGSKLVTLIMTIGQYHGKVWAKTVNSKIIHDHANSILHEFAEDYHKLVDAGNHGKDLQDAFEREGGPLHRHSEATENAFKNVFQCVRQDNPFEKYEISAETLIHFEVEIGFLYINPSGYKLILMSISRSIHEGLVHRLLKDRPVLSVMIDTSTDISSQSTLAIVFHIFGKKGEVKVALY